MNMKAGLWLTVSAFALVAGGAGLHASADGGAAWSPIAGAHAGDAEGGKHDDGAEGGEHGDHAEGGDHHEGVEGGAEGVEGGALGTYSLSSTDPNAFNFDAAPQIAAYVALVHDAYGKAAKDAAAMRFAIDAFLAAPSEAHLVAARNAWINARTAYLLTEAYRFYDGPIEEIEGRINAWPMNEAFLDYVEGAPESGIINDPSLEISIETVLEKDQITDEADVTTGWHAIEFLLWGQDLSGIGAGTRPASDYAPGEGNNDRRRTYLKLVTDQLMADLESLTAAWDASDPQSYAASFLALPQREALGRIVNGLATLAGFEMMSERLAVALDSGDQEDEHSCFSDNTNADFIYDLQGIKNVWFGDSNGANRAGLDQLVAERDRVLADKVTGLLNAAEAALADLDRPFDRVLAAPPDSEKRMEAEAAVTALGALGEGLKEAGNKLGVLVLIPS